MQVQSTLPDISKRSVAQNRIHSAKYTVIDKRILKEASKERLFLKSMSSSGECCTIISRTESLNMVQFTYQDDLLGPDLFVKRIETGPKGPQIILDYSPIDK
jgi:hypothetical protein